MIISLKKGSSENEIKKIEKKISDAGLEAITINEKERTVLLVIDGERKLDLHHFEAIRAVDKVSTILKPYKLASRETKEKDTVIDVNGIKIGGKEIIVMAGPCSIESEERTIEIAKAVKKSGAKFLRGGAFKPRTSPYSFQGLGEDALKMMKKAKEITGLNIITEVMDTADVDLITKYADIVQVGARNSQNFQLLKKLGKCGKPILLKRAISGTIQELLMSAEYILAHGNPNVILCERGIRTFETSTRNTTDINAIPLLKQLTHLPVMLDPSHSTGNYSLVRPIARAGIAAGADGLIVEVHPNPEEAYSDGKQSLIFENFDKLISECSAVAKAINRNI